MLLRVGIHSGPVIAGVHYVGNKIPRFRLYGETVQIAFKLRTTGEGEERFFTGVLEWQPCHSYAETLFTINLTI